MNTNFIKNLDDETLDKIADAQMADLIQRRGIKDPDLFKDCFRRSFDAWFDPDGTDPRIIVKIVENFSEVAGDAFNEYHAIRAKQRADAKAQAEADAYEAAQPDAEVDNTESENEDDGKGIQD